MSKMEIILTTLIIMVERSNLSTTNQPSIHPFKMIGKTIRAELSSHGACSGPEAIHVLDQKGVVVLHLTALSCSYAAKVNKISF